MFSIDELFRFQCINLIEFDILQGLWEFCVFRAHLEETEGGGLLSFAENSNILQNFAQVPRDTIHFTLFVGGQLPE